MKRVVITGLGGLTPLGNDVATYWNNLLKGVPGARAISYFDASQFKTRFACDLKDFDIKDYMDRKTARKTDPYVHYALIAAEQAVKDSGLDFDKMDPLDSGVIWGSGQGGMKTFEEEIKNYAEGNYRPRFNPFFVPKIISNMAAGMISIKYGLMGINYAVVTACSTSNTALMDALNYIRMGKAKVIVTGGSEAPITEASVGGFSSMKALSNDNDNPEGASRPFDPTRNGFVLGEGAGALILEDLEHAKQRGAAIYAEIVGASMTADAYHMTGSHPNGDGSFHSMRLAIKDAGLAPKDIDYINAHATSTPVGDPSETKAIARLFGNDTDQMHLSGTKSMTGHLLGGAGAVEAIATIQAIRNNVIPPTINTKEIDEAIPKHLNIVLGEPVEKKVKVGMSNTFGFGGHNSTIVFKEFED
ncbi:MAG TPA: beta-ketoacyl-ACP synthase II [Chitinophagaceae bacterium]|nr:beta-ketoacyl-ACP synthase II [Chitinophagaceae bacterium]